MCLNNPRDYWNFWKRNKSKQSVTEILDIETFREYYIRQNEVGKNPDFDYELMQKIDEFINSNELLFDTLHESSLCDILNSPIDKDEVIIALRKSKNNKAAGIDGHPVEFYKYSGGVLDNLLVALFNRIFKHGQSPDEWCEGIINPIHKKDDIMIPENYRKITIIPASGNFFETVLNNRAIYAKNILGMEDPFQNGFRHGARATDNAFLLNGLIDISSARKRPLYVCYIGVSGKYFKIIKSMFDNSKSRVKYNSCLSDIFDNLGGVLQGGVISPTLFKFFLDDLGEYLDTTKGIRVGNIRISHLLFADDLILVSETSSGLQKLIVGLQEYSKQWHMEVNLSKMRISTFNAKYEIGNHVHKFYYVNNEISEANDYDFLGITFSVKNPRFKRNHERIKEKAPKAIYAARNLAHKSLGNQIPATVLFKIFDSQIQPILDYGTEIWYQGKPVEELEVIHTGFIKKTLGLKKQTSTLVVYGESGRYPLEIRQKELFIKFWCRLLGLKPDNPLQIMYKELLQLHQSNHKTWCSTVLEVLQSIKVENMFENQCDLNMDDINKFRSEIKTLLQNQYSESWRNDTRNIEKHPILRTYSLFKTTLAAEPYITTKMDAMFKKCIARFRVSSHRLAIETGRHLKPPLPIESRVCVHCPGELVDDELHLINVCKHHDGERVRLYQIAKRYIVEFENLDNRAKFVAILGTSIPPPIIALENFLHTCFRLGKT